MTSEAWQPPPVDDSSRPVKTLLLLLGAAFLPYGLYCFAVPGFLAEAAGVAATTPTGTVEIRAMYGGLQAAFGLLLLAAARDPRLMLAGLAASAFVLPGLAFSRLLGALLDGGFTTYTAGALAFEITSGALAATLLRRHLATLRAGGTDRPPTELPAKGLGR